MLNKLTAKKNQNFSELREEGREKFQISLFFYCAPFARPAQWQSSQLTKEMLRLGIYTPTPTPSAALNLNGVGIP